MYLIFYFFFFKLINFHLLTFLPSQNQNLVVKFLNFKPLFRQFNLSFTLQFYKFFRNTLVQFANLLTVAATALHEKNWFVMILNWFHSVTHFWIDQVSSSCLGINPWRHWSYFWVALSLRRNRMAVHTLSQF